MNNENENVAGMMPSPAVPLEASDNGVMFQNAGGVGRAVANTEYAGASMPTVDVTPAQVNVQMPAVGPASSDVTVAPYMPEENVPIMQENPNVKVAPINLNATDIINQEEDYEELEEEYAEPVKTEEDIDLEKRNRSGMRFIVIFGLIILIFILLLPFLITII